MIATYAAPGARMESRSAHSATLVQGHANVVRGGPGPAQWAGDLSPITAAEWNYDRAAHLVDRAGFGAPPEEIASLATMSPAQAVASLLDYRDIPNDHLAP